MGIVSLARVGMGSVSLASVGMAMGIVSLASVGMAMGSISLVCVGKSIVSLANMGMGSLANVGMGTISLAIMPIHLLARLTLPMPIHLLARLTLPFLPSSLPLAAHAPFLLDNTLIMCHVALPQVRIVTRC